MKIEEFSMIVFFKKIGIQKGDSPNAIKTIFSTIITLGKWWEGKRGGKRERGIHMSIKLYHGQRINTKTVMITQSRHSFTKENKVQETEVDLPLAFAKSPFNLIVHVHIFNLLIV